MKIHVIQPPYPRTPEKTADSVDWMLRAFRECTDAEDLILLPEGCNAPSSCADADELRRFASLYAPPLLAEAKATAVRCGAHVGINLYQQTDTGLRNTTFLFDRDGREAARYEKIHLPVSEFSNQAIDHSYIAHAGGPVLAVVDGIRYSFMTCYDTYYTEMMNRISTEKPDVVLICSLQRAERDDIIEMQAKLCAFLCNAYVVRSSYGMGKDFTTGACSLIASPDGRILRNYGHEAGAFSVDVEDIHFKFRRSNGFGQPLIENDVYETLYRAPWTYRAGGSGVVQPDCLAPYPRLCAVNGVPFAAPTGTIPSIALAVSMGAPEVLLDLKLLADGIPVVDPVQALQYGRGLQDTEGGYGGAFEGIGRATLEDVFRTFPARSLFVLRLNGPDEEAADLFRETLHLAAKYDCLKHISFISSPTAAATAVNVAGGVAFWLQAGNDPQEDAVAAAKRLGCTGIIYETDVPAALTPTTELKCGVHCNDPQELPGLLARGFDRILTDDFYGLRKAFSENLKGRK